MTGFVIFWLLLVGAFLVSGWLSLRNRDLLWRWTEERYLRRGIRPERTYEWDRHQERMGKLAIFGALVIFACVCPFVLLIAANPPY